MAELLFSLSSASAFMPVHPKSMGPAFNAGRPKVGSISQAHAYSKPLGRRRGEQLFMTANGDDQEGTSSPKPGGKVPSAIAGERNLLAELPIPSVVPLIYLAIIGLSINDVVTNVRVDEWLAKGAALSDAPVDSVAGSVIFIGWFGFQLAKFLAGDKAEYYDDLEGLSVNSLSSQAAEWARAGVVPTHLGDNEVATFAGGCFWGTELHFQRIPGVNATCVGYTQGRPEFPTYPNVCSGTTGHTEALMLTYDPSVVSYGELCDKLFTTIDASALNRVGNDVGTQYRHGIYPHTDKQYDEAIEAIKREQARRDKWNQKVVTEVKSATIFYPAEKYHQRYLQKGGQSAAKGATEEVRCYG